MGVRSWPNSPRAAAPLEPLVVLLRAQGRLLLRTAPLLALLLALLMALLVALGLPLLLLLMASDSMMLLLAAILVRPLAWLMALLVALGLLVTTAPPMALAQEPLLMLLVS